MVNRKPETSGSDTYFKLCDSEERLHHISMVELVDTASSKGAGLMVMRVRVSLGVHRVVVVAGSNPAKS